MTFILRGQQNSTPSRICRRGRKRAMTISRRYYFATRKLRTFSLKVY